MLEKRQSLRFPKHYTIIFSLKNQPQKTYDMSGLIDISKGGLKFSSYEHYAVGEVMVIQIRFPFRYPHPTIIEGKIIDCQQVSGAKVYRIRIQFINLNYETTSALEEMDKTNRKTNK